MHPAKSSSIDEHVGESRSCSGFLNCRTAKPTGRIERDDQEKEENDDAAAIHLTYINTTGGVEGRRRKGSQVRNL